MEKKTRGGGRGGGRARRRVKVNVSQSGREERKGRLVKVRKNRKCVKENAQVRGTRKMREGGNKERRKDGI